MDDLCGMEVLDTFAELVEDEAVVGILEYLLAVSARGYPMALWRSASMYSNTR